MWIIFWGAQLYSYKFCRQNEYNLTAAVWMEHNQNTITKHQCVIQIKFPDHSWFFHQLLKNWLLSRGYFGSWGPALVAIAVVERWPSQRGLNKRQCMGCPLGQKKWPLVEVPLYYLYKLHHFLCTTTISLHTVKFRK